jgi:hypothetical protein
MLAATAMCDEAERTKALLERIEQLGNKSTQVLLFLSFAFVAVVTLKSDHITENQEQALTFAMRWWVRALVPVLLGILPVRDLVDYAKRKDRWYELIRWSKVVLLIGAVILILFGAWHFGRAIWPVGHPQAAGCHILPLFGGSGTRLVIGSGRKVKPVPQC